MDWKNKIGLIIGFLFGIIGLWILALLSLATPFVEGISEILFLPGRYFASLLVQDDKASNFVVTILFIINGIIYGIIGLIIEFLIRSYKKR